MEWQSFSPTETTRIGRELGKGLPPGAIVCLFGDLGAGKTTFVKGVRQGLLEASIHTPEIENSEVTSPTFTYLNIYPGAVPLYHFDLYRLRDADEFLSMGFEEFLHGQGISCLEWSEKIAPLIPSDALCVTLRHLGPEERLINLKSYDDRI